MSSSFESRRRKNGKIIAPVITHDNAAMVITMGEEEKRVGELDEWESLFTDSLPGQSGRYELEPVCVYIYIYICACGGRCARLATCNARPKRKAYFCNWAMLGCWLNYTTRDGYTFLLSVPLSQHGENCLPRYQCRTNEVGRASLLGFRVNPVARDGNVSMWKEARNYCS